LNLTGSEVVQLERDFFSGDQLDTGLIAYIRELRAAGHVVALLSNDSSSLRNKLRILHIADLFDPLVISAEIKVMKPDAAAFQYVLRLLRRSPQETIFIDDNVANCAAAVTLGIRAIHYTADTDLPKVLGALFSA
jgi:HAD superfamily hydrolase (TIGR01509 family)